MTNGRARLSPRERAVMGLPSFALGIVPLLATRRVARVLGLSQNAATISVIRLLGGRELVVALAFFRWPFPKLLWGFVAQDVMDLPLAWWIWSNRLAADDRRFRRACLGYAGLAVVDLYSAVTRNSGGRPG
jgi:hypothetical protein